MTIRSYATALALSALTLPALAADADKTSGDPTGGSPDTHGDPTAPPPKIEIVEDPDGAQALWDTKFATRLVDAVKSGEPIIDVLDPGPQCKDISAKKSFFMPLHEIDIRGHRFDVGIAGDAKLTADADKLSAEATFGPGLELFGQAHKPIDVRLTATTFANGGGNSLDLSLYAFGFQIDTYNIANSANPIDYLDVWAWSLPNVLTGQLGSGFDCSGLPGMQSCAGSWQASSSVVAQVGVLWGLHVDAAEGVRGGLYAATYAYAGTALGANVAGRACAFGECTDFDLDAKGFANINLIHAVFSGLAQLVPHDNRWLAAADYAVHAEDMLGANLVMQFPDPVGNYTIAHHDPASFDDAFTYQCTFDKNFK